ncbi:hypothetical protein HUJ05_008934 [Dendroctonus ponderosae]|nr:hypothetical protein HUJ05_008934 [Dendroctonus ponderosae]
MLSDAKRASEAFPGHRLSIMADAPIASENFIMDSKGASHVETLSLLQVWENGDAEFLRWRPKKVVELGNIENHQQQH